MSYDRGGDNIARTIRPIDYFRVIIIGGAVVALAGQGGFVPAQYRGGALAQVPIQALGEGEVFLELTVTSHGVVSAVRTLRATPPFTEAMSAVAHNWQFRPAVEEMEPEPGKLLDPPLALENGIVLIEARINTGGRVVEATVIRSAPPFDDPARDAARRWTFRPARVHGTVVPSLAYIVFAFRQPITLTPR